MRGKISAQNNFRFLRNEKGQSILALVIAVLIGIGVLAGLGESHVQKQIQETAMKYQISEGDLRVFLKVTDYDLGDFRNSEAVRLNFKRWCKGEGAIGRKTDEVLIPIPVPVNSR